LHFLCSQVWFKNRRAKYRKSKETFHSSSSTDENTNKTKKDDNAIDNNEQTPLPDSTVSSKPATSERECIFLDKTKDFLRVTRDPAPLRPTPIHTNAPLYGYPYSTMDRWLLPPNGFSLDWPFHGNGIVAYHPQASSY
jgi:hypothetical protein